MSTEPAPPDEPAPRGAPDAPDAVVEGGDLDCGSGLLLIIREAMAPLRAGGVLEVRSREVSVKEDLPAWCRMVGHGLLGVSPQDARTFAYRIQKRADDPGLAVDRERARAFRWTTRVRWTAGLAATAYARNHAVPVGQPASFETRDAAPAALELLLAGLGGCLAVGFQWRASRRGVAIKNLEVALEAAADDVLVFLGLEAPGSTGHPGLSSVRGKCYVEADADPALLADLWRETLARSPVTQTLARPVSVDVQLEVV